MPLSLLLMGSLDMGVEMYYRAQLQGALNDVARLATVEEPTGLKAGGTIEDQIDATIKARVGELVNSPTWTITRRNYYDFSRVGKPEKLTDSNSNGQLDKGECFQDDNGNGAWDQSTARTGKGGANDVVIYEVNMKAARLLPVASLFGASSDYDLTARTSVRNEPYADRPQTAKVCKT